MTDAGNGMTAQARTGQRDRAIAYREIAPLCIEWWYEGLTLDAIAKRLTARGYRTRQGKLYSKVQVMRILNYRGINTAAIRRSR